MTPRNAGMLWMLNSNEKENGERLLPVSVSASRSFYRFRSSTFPLTVDSRILGPPLPIDARSRRGSMRPLIVTGKSI